MDRSIAELEKEVKELEELMENPPPISDEIHIQMFPIADIGYEIDIKLSHDLTLSEEDDEPSWEVDCTHELERYESREDAYEEFLSCLDHYCSYALNERRSKLSTKGDKTPILLTSINHERLGYEIVGIGDSRHEQAEKIIGDVEEQQMRWGNLFETTWELAIIKYGISKSAILAFENRFLH